MIKVDIVNEVSKIADITKVKAEVAVDAVFDAMRTSMQRGERIELRGFGVFQVKPRKRGIAIDGGQAGTHDQPGNGRDADEHDMCVPGALEDLVGDAIDGPPDVRCREQGHHGRSGDRSGRGIDVRFVLGTVDAGNGGTRRFRPVWARWHHTDLLSRLTGRL